MQFPNTVAVERAKNLEQLPAVCRELISNPSSQDYLLRALTESVLAVHRPNRSVAMAADPLGGGHWQEVHEEEQEHDLLAPAPADPLFNSRKRPLAEFKGFEPGAKRRAAPTPAAASKVGYPAWDLVAFVAWMGKFDQGVEEAVQEKEGHAAILAAVPAAIRAEFGLPETCPIYVRDAWVAPGSDHLKQLSLVCAAILRTGRGSGVPAGWQGMYGRRCRLATVWACSACL